MHQTVSTDRVEPSQRLAFWTDMVCNTYVQLDCDAAAGAATIDGDIASDTLATLQLSTVTASPQIVRRTAAKIARASEDYFLVSIQTRGEGVIAQDGRTARLAPGDFALYDSTRPYELRFEAPFQQYVLRLPGPSLRTALRDTQRLTASTVSGQRGAGHLMIGMIQTLAADIGTLAPESAAAVAESVTQILIAGLSALPAARQQAVSHMTGYHREQIKACTRSRLRDPALTVASIAAQLRVSPSTLHRAWAGEACSIAEWIWAQRLDAARRDLCDPSLAARSVSEIAFSWGFNDAAHFSRAFRARFGCSARELRAGKAVA
ncbi:helix-turn-helix domain-containing protein [Aquabacterium sp.]|uniref:AraC-like ligand-binding domain-containing protein n=1 Tax=Aquabacterium sp. TaxID=1872578 RepID=UPI002C537231|nr:helix-turn-helix domain-containing protein [Aquabacterium sp.]HSW08566.1 helix-turn-helix domain-containing protein [Aquabacterium sp.]